MNKLILFSIITFSLNSLSMESDFVDLKALSNKELVDSPESKYRAMPEDYIGGYNDLLEYIFPSPYQGGAGSCLFMSHTANIEWWYNKINQTKIDLSERVLMNLAKEEAAKEEVLNWRTDTIYRMNSLSYSFLNEDFPFTKSYYKRGKDGLRVKAKESEPGSFYGEKYNWVIEYQNVKAKKIELPIFDREVLYADESENQWNVALAPKDAVQRVKNAISKRNAPVLVIYNHTGFWHANLIVGYNDYADTRGCPFVGTYDEKMNKRADEIIEESKLATTDKQKRKLERKAKRFRTRGKAVNDAFKLDGGCHEQGVFYVRDSIYPDNTMPIYDYDFSKQGEEEHLNAKVILREYQWLTHASNHAIQIYVKELDY